MNPIVKESQVFKVVNTYRSSQVCIKPVEENLLYKRLSARAKTALLDIKTSIDDNELLVSDCPFNKLVKSFPSI